MALCYQNNRGGAVTCVKSLRYSTVFFYQKLEIESLHWSHIHRATIHAHSYKCTTIQLMANMCKEITEPRPVADLSGSGKYKKLTGSG